MSDMCNDNRFELIAKYKAKLIESTNIDTSADEMAVIDNILFRMWQIGWLDRLEQPTVDAVPVRHGHWEIVPNDENTDGYYKMRCSVCGGTLWGIQSEELFCCKCGAKMDGADGEAKHE